MDPKTPYHWKHASSWRDAGDLPPRANRAVLKYAVTHGIPLTADHLINGADAAEIEALLAQRPVAAE